MVFTFQKSALLDLNLGPAKGPCRKATHILPEARARALGLTACDDYTHQML